MMKRGFLTFVLASVFLLAIVSAAFRLSQAKGGNSYQKYQLAALQELSIKSAFYQSAAAAARDAYARAGDDPRSQTAAVNAAVAENAVAFESGLKAAAAEQGYEVLFWCGPADTFSRQRASEQMYLSRHAIAPGLSQPVPLCAQSFSADVLNREIHIRDFGFSSYSGSFGFGYAAAFPPDYVVDFS